MMGSAVMLPPPRVIGQTGGPLQQAGMEIEHVAGIGLAARRALQQQAESAR